MTNKNRAGTILSSFAYTYRADGNILTEVDHTGATTTYGYDMLGRLVSEVGNSGSRFYTYDTAGNRTQVIIDTATTISYNYNSDGSLASETSSNGSVSETTAYAYDLNGNLTAKTKGVSVTNYAYDVWGNMTSGAGATYAYNAQGLRVAKTVNGETDNFTLVGGNVWSDSTTNYLRGIELISNGTQLYLYNVRGDVIQLLGFDGEVDKTYDYDAYGNELQQNSNDSNPFRYCGEYYDTETGFIYLRARYYDPMVGRFTTVDPIKDGLNWYAYCACNPVMFVDSNGLWIETIWDIFSFGSSVVEVAANPTSIGAWIGLAGDAIDIFIPGGGIGEAVDAVRAGVKVSDAVDDIVDTAKAIDRVTDTVDSIHDASKTADRIGDSIESTSSAIRKAGNAFENIELPSSRTLRKNMRNSGIVEPEYSNAAHHIVAGRASGAKESRSILEKFSISINDASNGVFLPNVKNLDGVAATFHNSMHTKTYYDTVNKLLRDAESADEAKAILRNIAGSLELGIFMK